MPGRPIVSYCHVTICYRETTILIIIVTMPIVDFWGPYAEVWGGGGSVVEIKEWMQCICLCFTPSRIALVESAHLFCGSLCFQLVFFFFDCTIFTLHSLTDFYVERVINDHSCFHNLWPNSKTKLK